MNRRGRIYFCFGRENVAVVVVPGFFAYISKAFIFQPLETWGRGCIFTGCVVALQVQILGCRHMWGFEGSDMALLGSVAQLLGLM